MKLNENLFLEWVDDSFDWEYVDSKEVEDSDGFMTEYTWYKRLLPSSEEQHIFIFGDSDIYGPDDSYADAEFDSYDLAKEWFDNYYGFDHDAEDLSWIEFAEDRGIKEDFNSEALKRKPKSITYENVLNWFIDNEHRYVNKYHHFSHVADDFRIFMDYVDQEFPDAFDSAEKNDLWIDFTENIAELSSLCENFKSRPISESLTDEIDRKLI